MPIMDNMPLFLVKFPDMGLNLVNGRMDLNAGARRRHDRPIGRIDQHAGDKRPFSTHSRFDGMNRTDFIPENAESVFLLRQNRPVAGHLTKFFQKVFRIGMDIGGDFLNIAIRQIRSAVSLTAASALLTCKHFILF
jgi:hypothetical protein